MTPDDARQLLESDVVAASRAILGWHLVRGACRVQIVEVEAYRAEDDAASHAHRGVTKRNEIMFGEPGHAYVYFSYGVHWMLNVVAHPPGRAAAILIRAAKPLEGIDEMRDRRLKAKTDQDLLSGPGKVCAALGITSHEHGIDLLTNPDLHLEPQLSAANVLVGPRIGITKAVDFAWRFVDADNLEWASRPRTGLA